MRRVSPALQLSMWQFRASPPLCQIRKMHAGNLDTAIATAHGTMNAKKHRPLPTPPFEGLKLGRMLSHGEGVKAYQGVYRGRPVLVRLFKDATWLRSMCGVPLEAAISASHPHPNLARCSAMRRRGGSSGGDGVWTVTETFERSLQEAIIAKRFVQTDGLEAHVRKRNLRDALHIAGDVAEVMVFLHSMDIVHGRLTPGHVMLAEDARQACGCRAVLTGYGLAHAKPLDVAESPNIVRGAEIAHWSPERLIDAVNSKAGDVFAFGMMLVSMLTGDAPWAGRSGPQIVLAAGILRLRPPPPPRVLPPLASLINLCLRAQPAERPTFEMAAAILRGLLAQGCAVPP
ncbi:hypothetical protein WJX81_006223 [Elliptochloris bilobata]|uniref:Protein kinase domain-containing protein n=1 Tax=Elliptochloris bilobata TaxID=381761 RepID=A0AAW1RCL7_9CHLO